MPTATETLTQQPQGAAPPNNAAAAAAAAAGAAPPPNTDGSGKVVPEWAKGFTSPEDKAWLADKGYASPEILASSARSLETLWGADKAGRTIVKPKGPEDVEGLKAYRKALGVPDTAEGYKLPLPEGVTDDAFAKTASQWFHKAGIPPEAAAAIASEWNGFIAGEVAKGKQADDARSAEGLTRLRGEWGGKYDENSEVARRGLRAIGQQAGLDEKDLTALENAIGSDKMLKAFFKIGELNRETPGDVPGGDNKGFAKPRAELQAEMDQILKDRAEGKIDDYAWRSVYEPRQQQIIKSLTGG